jgi:hypothetical protein
VPSNGEAQTPGRPLGSCLGWLPIGRPVGCLFRLAPQPDKGTYSKGSLIVNLSGYGGIAVERGLGLIRESLDIVRLEEEDIIKIFAASTLLMAAITRQPIDWSQRQPR